MRARQPRRVILLLPGQLRGSSRHSSASDRRLLGGDCETLDGEPRGFRSPGGGTRLALIPSLDAGLRPCFYVPPSSSKERNDAMIKVVLLRHGESSWNLENRFTGWTDVDLSPKGIEEAHEAARVLKEGGYTFDLAFTSVLKRAIRTLWIVLDDMDLMWLPVQRHWRLNERHYGDLQGLNKAETAAKFGEAQVKIWRRAYDTPPPALKAEDERFPGRDRRYASLSTEELPLTESLKDTVARFLPLLARDDRAGDQVGQARPHRRPRQQPPGARQVPRQHLRRRDRRAEHPDGHAARLRAGRRPQAAQALLPRRSRGGPEGRRGGGQAGREEVGARAAGPTWSRRASHLGHGRAPSGGVSDPLRGCLVHRGPRLRRALRGRVRLRPRRRRAPGLGSDVARLLRPDAPRPRLAGRGRGDREALPFVARRLPREPPVEHRPRRARGRLSPALCRRRQEGAGAHSLLWMVLSGRRQHLHRSLRPHARPGVPARGCRQSPQPGAVGLDVPGGPPQLQPHAAPVQEGRLPHRDRSSGCPWFP